VEAVENVARHNSWDNEQSEPTANMKENTNKTKNELPAENLLGSTPCSASEFAKYGCYPSHWNKISDNHWEHKYIKMSTNLNPYTKNLSKVN